MLPTLQIPYAPFESKDDEEHPVLEAENTIRPAYSALQLLLMCSLTFQQIALPLLVRFAKQQNTDYMPTVLVFIAEVIKLIVCLAIIAFQNRPIKKFAEVLYTNIACNLIDTLETSVPAVAYAIQNNLYYIALHHINAAQYTAMYQLRILTTAILSKIMLRKAITVVQWLSLISLAVGVVLAQLPKNLDQTNQLSFNGNFIVGILAVFAMCWTSAFAGVYFEKVLKKSVLDMWIENLRLGLMTLIFSAVAMFASDGTRIWTEGLFHGWTKLIWLIAFLNSVGGLIVSAVLKYADNIKKTLCQSMAIACVSGFSVMTNDAPANPLLFCGIFLVVLSTYVYSVGFGKN